MSYINYVQENTAIPERIGISLSGGGLRAALLAAGAVSAIIDAKLNDKVRWVSSVSGGSLLNGMLQSSGMLCQNDNSEYLQNIILKITTATGLKTSRVVHSIWNLNSPLSFERYINHTWLSDDLSVDNGRIAHIYCAAELRRREPAFLTSGFSFTCNDDGLAMLLDDNSLDLSRMMRASCTFPMLPTVKVRNSAKYDKTIYHLGDGGLWNNLATSWKEVGLPAAKHEIGLSGGLEEDVDYHLVVDSQTAVVPFSCSLMDWPILGRGISVLQAFKALYQSSLTSSVNRVGWLAGFGPDGENGSLIDFRRSFWEVQRREALAEVVQLTRDEWRRRQQLSTAVGLRLAPLSRDEAFAIYSIGYVLVAAHLTFRFSVDFCNFRSMEAPQY